MYSQFQILYCLLIILAAPMICSSVQTGIECPGLPFGLADVPAGWRRRVLQVAVAVLSPITVLLLRLQFQLTQKGFRVTSLEQMSLVINTV